jgi:hypothetical protein
MLYLKALNSKFYFRHSEVWPQEGHLSRQSSLEVWSHGGHLIRRYLLYVAATTLRLLLQNSNFWIVQSLYFFVRTQVPSQELGNLTRPGCRLLVVYTLDLSFTSADGLTGGGVRQRGERRRSYLLYHAHGGMVGIPHIQ